MSSDLKLFVTVSQASCPSSIRQPPITKKTIQVKLRIQLDWRIFPICHGQWWNSTDSLQNAWVISFYRKNNVASCKHSWVSTCRKNHDSISNRQFELKSSAQSLRRVSIWPGSGGHGRKTPPVSPQGFPHLHHGHGLFHDRIRPWRNPIHSNQLRNGSHQSARCRGLVGWLEHHRRFHSEKMDLGEVLQQQLPPSFWASESSDELNVQYWISVRNSI